MPTPKYEIVWLSDGYAIEIHWPNGSVETIPGLFTTEEAAAESVSSQGFMDWWEKRLRGETR